LRVEQAFQSCVKEAFRRVGFSPCGTFFNSPPQPLQAAKRKTARMNTPF
jgi:hypothetical protein